MKSYISDGLVSETVLLLDAIVKYKCTNIHEIMELRITYGINKQAALSFALQCRWAIQDHGSINITATGMSVVSQFDGCSLNRKLWRIILRDYVISSSPAWSKRIPSGRKEAYIFMTPDEKRCFMESGLMDKPVDDAIVQWWDTITKTIREEHQVTLEETGRIGERLTIKYERNRTHLEPEWESIESNVVGYDVLSSREESCLEPILIEVKTSTLDCTMASMVISRNEWNVASCACNRDRYYFYLWLLGCEKQLARITVDEVEKHIPSNTGSGKWKDAEVPFSCFVDRFQVINT